MKKLISLFIISLFSCNMVWAADEVNYEQFKNNVSKTICNQSSAANAVTVMSTLSRLRRNYAKNNVNVNDDVKYLLDSWYAVTSKLTELMIARQAKTPLSNRVMHEAVRNLFCASLNL